MDDDDSYFFVGGLRCKARANWNILIGVRQLPKAMQNTVKMRVDEDREQAVRRFVHDKKHTEAAALIDAVHGACPCSTRIHAFFAPFLPQKRETVYSFAPDGSRCPCCFRAVSALQSRHVFDRS